MKSSTRNTAESNSFRIAELQKSRQNIKRARSQDLRSFFMQEDCRKKKSMVCCRNGLSLGGSVTLCKGGDAMNCVTYSDLIQIGILVVALISLYQNRG